MIERGEAAFWISTASRHLVMNTGQEVNRLFQILVEGQGSAEVVPLVDSHTLALAAKRTDLFTEKQCRRIQNHIEHLARCLQKEENLKLLLAKNPAKTDEELNKIAEAGWTCDQCTYLNNDNEDKCGACASERIQSFVTIAKRKPSTKNLVKDKPLVSKQASKNVLLKSSPTRGSSNTVWVHNKHIPEMIGAKGVNQRSLIAKSGASSVYAFQDKLDKDEMCPVVVYGSLEAFQKVVAILEKKFNAMPEPSVKKTVENMTSQTVYINNNDVPEMIGPGGDNVKRMKQQTGVESIKAWQEYVDEAGLCPVVIRGGRSENVQKAATDIMNMFCGDTGMNLAALRAAKQLNFKQHSSSKVVEKEATAVAFRVAPKNPSNNMIKQPATSDPAKSVDLASEETNMPKQESPTVPQASRSFPIGAFAMMPTNNPTQGVGGTVQPPTPLLPCVSKPEELPKAIPSRKAHPQPLNAPEKEYAIITSNAPGKEKPTGTVLQVLQENEKCFTCSAAAFGQWLESVDISSLEDFVEALEDDDFVSLEMKQNGLKYFKRFALKNAAVVAVAAATARVTASAPEDTSPPPMTTAPEPPVELVCPIGHVLMTEDPVLTPDGYTYERQAIEDWLRRQGQDALSPMTQEPLGADAVHKLVSNLQIRTLARDWNQTHLM